MRILGPRRLVGPALCLALLAQAAPALAAPASEEPVRLLVTYAAPVDAEVEVAAAPGASMVGDPFTSTTGDTPGSVGGDSSASAVQVIEFSQPVDARDTARRLAARPDVVAVEPDLPLSSDGRVERILDGVVSDASVRRADGRSVSLTSQSSPGSGSSLGSGASTVDGSSLTSNSSWGVTNDGGSIDGVPGIPGIDVGATMLWSRTTGREVVVAVIDSGVDIDHPILHDHIWENSDELGDGADTDANGYVDDLNGWDFVADRPLATGADVDGHGTHVAGIIAGTPYPELGFQSVAPDVQIMPLKFIEGEQGRTSDAIAALRYAQANGADVINASWGGPDPSRALLREVLEELSVPVVVSAGNLGAEPGSPAAYPAAFGLPNLVSVASIDHAGRMSSFSSRDRDVVDVVAPGERILSTWPGRRMAELSGTSQAAPHVAGVLALALQRHPGLGPAVIAEAVRRSVRPLAAAEETRSGGLVRAPGLLDALGTRVPACPSLREIPFVDVGPDGAHHDAVACMLSLGVTSGTSATTYGAADGLSRAHIATMLANALERSDRLPPVPATSRFTDLEASMLHRNNIERLAAVGIVRGSSATRYDPLRTVTRAEFAATVVRAAEWLSGGEIRATGPRFDDIQGHAHEAGIIKAAGLRIVTGKAPGVFDPDATLRRDQAASMVTRLLDRLVQQGLMAVA